MSEKHQQFEELLTIDDATAVLKVKPSWIYGHIHFGTLPFEYIKVGRYIRFPRSAVVEFLRQQTITPSIR